MRTILEAQRATRNGLSVRKGPRSRRGVNRGGKGNVGLVRTLFLSFLSQRETEPPGERESPLGKSREARFRSRELAKGVCGAGVGLSRSAAVWRGLWGDAAGRSGSVDYERGGRDDSGEAKE